MLIGGLQRIKRPDMFLGGFLMAPLLFGMLQKENVSPNSIIAIRFEPDIQITPILENVIKNAFLEGPTDYSIELDLTEKAELKIFNTPKKVRSKPILVFPLISRGWSKKDSFFIIGIRDQMGNPLTLNITLLRHLLLKLKEEKTKFEIW